MLIDSKIYNMRIGTVKLENNLILAPMLKVTTGPYRRFCRKFDTIGLVHVPMIYIKSLEKNPHSIYQNLYKIEEEHPISIQLIGGERESFKNALDILSSYNYDILDINAGCPSKRAIHSKEGGFLLKDLTNFRSILDITTKFSSRPISLKIRSGFTSSDELFQIIDVINNFDIDLVSIHGRTVKDRFELGKLDINSIKILKENLSVPVVGNGDINSPQKAKRIMEYTNVDGLMIGRASMGNPRIFYQIRKYLECEKLSSNKKRIEDITDSLILYEDIIDQMDYSSCETKKTIDEIKFEELRRNAIWLTKSIKNSTEMRIKLSKSKDLKNLKQKFKELFNL